MSAGETAQGFYPQSFGAGGLDDLRLYKPSSPAVNAQEADVILVNVASMCLISQEREPLAIATASGSAPVGS
jgi:hypothetical protein